MKKILACILITMVCVSMTACSSDSTEEATLVPSEDGTEEVVSSSEMITEEATEVATGEVTVVGQVISVAGNMVTIQVGSYIEQEGMSGGMAQGNASGMMEGDLSEEEMEAMMESGEMPEGMEDMSEEEMEAMMEERQSGDGMTGEMPEGMTEGEMPEGMTEGAMPGMTEGTEGGIVAVDMSEVIELTDEEVQITIPVGTPVYSMGIEYDFTDIVEECYITISEDEDGTIVAVNILG